MRGWGLGLLFRVCDLGFKRWGSGFKVWVLGLGADWYPPFSFSGCCCSGDDGDGRSTPELVISASGF